MLINVMAILKVQNNSNLVRDSNTGAIINVNDAERQNVLSRRANQIKRNQQIEQTTKQIDELSIRVDNIESKLDCILDLLRKSA